MVVGLGNPGPRYARTRHNAGFWFVDALATRAGAGFRAAPRFFGETCEPVVDGQRLRVLKPSTFMNRSGQSVAAVVRYFGYGLDEVLIVHDEVDFPPGTVRLKRGGGHGGHNGLRDVLAHLGSGEFARLRIGVGHPGNSREVMDYVLDRPLVEQERLIHEALERALEVMPHILAGELARAMNVLNRKRAPDEPTESSDNTGSVGRDS